MDSNNNHTQVVEEASLKVGGDKEDVALGIDNNQEQILETVIIVANQAFWPRECRKKQSDMKNGRLQ